MQFDKVISVCTSKDIDVWEIAAFCIIERINSRVYDVIVPDKELNLFRRISPSIYNVISENIYFEKFLPSLQKFSDYSKTSMNWYIQQFLKLSALSEIGKDEIALIWDADTIPLRKIKFEKNGKLVFYKSNEYHEPYFKVIKNLLGLEKNINYSYIAQCIPCKGSWIKSLINEIERDNISWQQLTIDSIDFTQASGFSEYETIGTYIQARFSDEMHISDKKWLRYGNGLIGSARHLKYFSWILSIKYDFVSFEKWDPPYSTLKKIFKKIVK